MIIHFNSDKAHVFDLAVFDDSDNEVILNTWIQPEKHTQEMVKYGFTNDDYTISQSFIELVDNGDFEEIIDSGLICWNSNKVSQLLQEADLNTDSISIIDLKTLASNFLGDAVSNKLKFIDYYEQIVGKKLPENFVYLRAVDKIIYLNEIYQICSVAISEKKVVEKPNRYNDVVIKIVKRLDAAKRLELSKIPNLPDFVIKYLMSTDDTQVKENLITYSKFPFSLISKNIEELDPDLVLKMLESDNVYFDSDLLRQIFNTPELKNSHISNAIINHPKTSDMLLGMIVGAEGESAYPMIVNRSAKEIIPQELIHLVIEDDLLKRQLLETTCDLDYLINFLNRNDISESEFHSIAMNPNIDKKIIIKILDSTDSLAVYNELLPHKELDSEALSDILDGLMQSEPEETSFLIQALQNPNVTSEIVMDIFDSHKELSDSIMLSPALNKNLFMNVCSSTKLPNNVLSIGLFKILC